MNNDSIGAATRDGDADTRDNREARDTLLLAIDTDLRAGTPTKDIAPLLDTTPTGVYPRLAAMGARIATTRYLVDIRTGRPIRRRRSRG